MAHHSSDSGSFFALSRHDDYWINGGDLYFLVEHVQYRVHRYFFERESPFFKSRLTTPASPGASRQGSAESNAIVLENVRSADFAKFLWVFYNPKYSLYHTTVEDWTTILDLAHQWQFTEVKNLVVRELEKLEIPDVNRISTYHKYDIDRNLLISRYAALCEREDPLTLKEGLLLGMDTTLMIARTREYARSNPTPTGARSPTAAHIRQDEMHSLVRLLFEIQPPAEGSEDQGDATKTAPAPVSNGASDPEASEPAANGSAAGGAGQGQAGAANGTATSGKEESKKGEAAAANGSAGPINSGGDDTDDPFRSSTPTRGGRGSGQRGGRGRKL